MKGKTILSIALGLFVVFCIAYMVMPKKDQQAKGDRAVQQQSKEKRDTVVVYYFFDKRRCKTCIQIETLTKKSLDENYGKELEEGSVQWKPINTDQPENKHFLKDYNIMSKSVVLSKIKDGKETQSTNLTKVWELVGNETQYMNYVRDEVAAYVRSK